MRVYIAGPMTGLPELNFPKFRAVAEFFRSAGWEVLNPVEIGQKHFPEGGVHANEYLIKDILELVTCDTICLLPGWTASIGARCEAAIAVTLGLTFVDENGESFFSPPSVTCDRAYPKP